MTATPFDRSIDNAKGRVRNACTEADEQLWTRELARLEECAARYLAEEDAKLAARGC